MYEPLDPRQIQRIEAVHRGFLYQHLYASGCLLLAGQHGVREVTVELDEDIDLTHSSGDRTYVQVKTRSSPLVDSDISGALQRFELIRGEHNAGKRPGKPAFAIVSNVAPGVELLRRVTSGGLPADVALLWPDAASVVVPGLPPAWPDVAGAVDWCAKRAEALPMAMLEPETLVWKLAGQVQLASAGGAKGHSFDANDLPRLFEQLAVQMQQFPTPPEVYRPLDGEPSLERPVRVRIITGLSGAGKTAWAAHAAVHSASECAYYDVGDVPGPAIAASLVRELAAQWAAPTAGALRKILLPGATGIDALRMLDQFLGSSGTSALVVLDNAHRVPMSDLRMLIDATKHLRIVMLAQPSESISKLEAVTGLSQEPLLGWSLDQVAAELHAQKARASAIDVGRFRALTGGLPLYVRTAAQLCKNQYDGDVAALCLAIEKRTNLVETAQDVILSQSFDALSEVARDCAAVLSLSDVPLSGAEGARLVAAALGASEAEFAAAVRHLRSLGVLRVFGGQRLQIHDALRLIGLRRFVELPATKTQAAREELRKLIVESFVKDKDASRFPLYIRTLVELKDIMPLIDIATEEWFHELGVGGGIWETLEVAVANEAIDPLQRFNALDGLVFAYLKAGEMVNAGRCLQEMSAILKLKQVGRREELVYQLKKMVFEADQGNDTEARRAMRRVQKITPNKPDFSRIVRYNTAYALFKLKSYRKAEDLVWQVVRDYYALLGLSPIDVVGLSNSKLAELLTPSATLHDDLKHLADSLELMARVLNSRGRDSGFARVHAAKFYGLASAPDSLIRVTQDLVDEFVGRGDYVGAREVIEQNLLPIVLEANLLDRVILARSQYAVILAYCGAFDAADDELARLEPYRAGTTGAQRLEIDSQRQLVAALRRNALAGNRGNGGPF